MKKMYLECGKISNAHGVRGVVKIEHWCDTPYVLSRAARVFFAEEGGYRERKVISASVSGNTVLMSIEGIDTREAAVANKGTVLYLSREDIPVKRGDMLIADMIGLPVIDARDGRKYGELSEVSEAVRGKLYTVKTPEGREVLLPGVPEFIKRIDAEEGVFITPIPGFFED